MEESRPSTTVRITSLDAQAVLGYFGDEPGSAPLVASLEQVQQGTTQACINVLNLTEVRCILLRPVGSRADGLIDWLLGTGVALVGAESTWREAARIKAAFPVSLGDAFALATGLLQKATVVTRDESDFDAGPALGVEVRRRGPRAKP